MRRYLYTYYYIKDNKSEIETKIELTDDITDVVLPYQSIYYAIIDEIDVDTKFGKKPENTTKHVHEYAIGTFLTRKQAEDEYGKDSQVAVDMMVNADRGLCVNQTCDGYVRINSQMDYIDYRKLHFKEKLLFAEIHFNTPNADGKTKTSVMCNRPYINNVNIPQDCKNISYIKFYEIYSDSKYVGERKAEFYSKPIYLDKKYLVGEKIDFKDIDENKLPAKTYLDLKGTYLEDNTTTFCKTANGVTTLSKDELLISEKDLYRVKSI